MTGGYTHLPAIAPAPSHNHNNDITSPISSSNSNSNSNSCASSTVSLSSRCSSVTSNISCRRSNSPESIDNINNNQNISKDPPIACIITSKNWVLPPRPKPGRKPASNDSSHDSKKKSFSNRSSNRENNRKTLAKINELEDKLIKIEKINNQRETDLNNALKRANIENSKLRCIITKLKSEISILKDLPSSTLNISKNIINNGNLSPITIGSKSPLILSDEDNESTMTTTIDPKNIPMHLAIEDRKRFRDLDMSSSSSSSTTTILPKSPESIDCPVNNLEFDQLLITPQHNQGNDSNNNNDLLNDLELDLPVLKKQRFDSTLETEFNDFFILRRSISEDKSIINSNSLDMSFSSSLRLERATSEPTVNDNDDPISFNDHISLFLNTDDDSLVVDVDTKNGSFEHCGFCTNGGICLCADEIESQRLKLEENIKLEENVNDLIKEEETSNDCGLGLGTLLTIKEEIEPEVSFTMGTLVT